MAKDKKKGQILKPTNLNASVIKSGILEIARIPPVAIERLITVADQTERFNLTSDDVSTGDTVKQLDINMMYRVQDTDKLDSEDGYTEFMAATYWDNVQSKPSTFPPDTDDIDSHLSGGTGINYSAGTISTDDANIDHNSLNNFVSNEHIDHSNVSIFAGTGLSGSGNITTDITISLDANIGTLNNVNTDTFTAGQLLIYDNTNSEFVNSTLTASTGVNITNSDGLITIENTDTGSDAVSSHETTYNHNNFLTSVSYDDLGGTPSDRITAGDNLSWDGETLNVVDVVRDSDIGTMASRNVTISTDSPSGGNDGDIWYQVGS